MNSTEKRMTEPTIYTKCWGTEYKLTFRKDTYYHGKTLAIQILAEEQDGFGFKEPFCSLTVNLPIAPNKPNMAYIDTNHVPADVIQKLMEEKVFTYTGVEQMSGYCIYPEAEFDQAWLNLI